MNTQKDFSRERVFLAFVLSIFWLSIAAAGNPASVQAMAPVVFLPVVSVDTDTSSASPNTTPEASCGLSPEALSLMIIIRDHAEQQRDSLICDPILTQVATDRAIDMAARSYFSHITPEGYGPNYLAAAAGFSLPSLYRSSDDANYIESLSAGTSDFTSAFNLLYESDGHRTHLLGESSFYSSQTHIGIGMVHDPNSVYRYYWVILISEKE